MSDLKAYIRKRKKSDVEFRDGFEEGYKAFKIGCWFVWRYPPARDVKTAGAAAAGTFRLENIKVAETAQSMKGLG